jgi:hypothetical protein
MIQDETVCPKRSRIPPAEGLGVSPSSLFRIPQEWEIKGGVNQDDAVTVQSA